MAARLGSAAPRLARAARLGHAARAGQAMVELALILPVLALLTLGVVDLGRVFYEYEALANAAREGARYCALHPGDATGTQAQVQREVSSTVGSVTSSGCTNPGQGQPVTVTVQAPFAPVTPLIGNLVGNPMTVRTTATMVVW